MSAVDQEVQPGANKDIALEKIKFGEKFAYSLVSMSTSPFLALTASFLGIFYTDVVKLDPIAVGTLFLIGRIMDGLSDPISGFVIDHLPRTKMGKYRYLLVGGGIITSLNFLLVWFGPVWSPVAKLEIAYVSYLLLGWTFDILDVSKNSLSPAMTVNPKERSSLGILNGFFNVLSGALVAIGAPIILTAGGSSLGSYYTLILVVIGATLLFAIVGGLGIKERVVPVADAATKYSVKDYLKIFIQRPVYMSLVYAFMISAGFRIVEGVGAYFYTYVMHDLKIFSSVAFLQLLGLIPGIFLSGLISSRLGKKRTLVGAALIGMAVFMIRWVDPTSLGLIYVSTIGVGIALGIFSPVSAVILADNTDYVEYKLNYRSEPAVASFMTFISKAASGLAGALPGFALGLTGYIANSQQQPAPAINAMIFLAVGMPVIFFAAAALIFGLGYNLDKNLLQKVETTLSEKRAAKLAKQD